MSRVLIVDDDAAVRISLRRILQNAGHVVEEVAEGEECLRTLSAFDPDLMFLDIFMPGRDGLETLLTLRRSGSRVPVVAMSGGGKMIEKAPVLQAAALMGAVATLRKPIRAADLLRTVDECSAEAGAARASVASW